MQTSHTTTTGSTTRPIGGWFTFDGGPAAGIQVTRFTLEELQKADVGRRYGRKDKRPLDPPPVVRFRMFQLINPGTPYQAEQEVEIQDEQFTFGLICHLDLFPVPRPRRPSEDFSPQPLGPSLLPSPLPGPQWPDGASTGSPILASPPERTVLRQPGLSPTSSPTSDMDAHVSTTCGTRDEETVFDGFPGSVYPACTGHLAGETFVACSLVEYEGRMAAMFVFSDIAVKREGWFALRYRVFHVQCRPQGYAQIPILAELHGGPFEIFSTKNFPGLHASTDLTKRLSLSGVRVNSRHKERKTGKRTGSGSAPKFDDRQRNSDPRFEHSAPSGVGRGRAVSRPSTAHYAAQGSASSTVAGPAGPPPTSWSPALSGARWSRSDMMMGMRQSPTGPVESPGAYGADSASPESQDDGSTYVLW